MHKYFKRVPGVGSGNYIYFWKSKNLSDERINSNTASHHIITPDLSHYGTKARVKFSGSCLKQVKTTYNYGTIVSIYIVYDISVCGFESSCSHLIKVIVVKKHFLINQSIILYCSFPLNICECLVCHRLQ